MADVAPLRLNSQCINFAEWITLFTLCLAPLIAHIVSGAPSPSILSRTRPKWWDWLCQYNPTSILWRYAAIADRRLRARRWSKDDFAASNAIFWTEHGWEGGEHMVQAAAPHCLRLPQYTHVEPLSITSLKTIIVTLQGAAAFYSLIGTLVGVADLKFIPLMGVDLIFYPLAVLGILRLCAAAWLTEDFTYAPITDSLDAPPSFKPVVKSDDIPLMAASNSYDPWLTTPLQTVSRFNTPNTSWPSRIFRTFFFLCVVGTFAITLLLVVPFHPSLSMFTVTSLNVGVFYSLLLLAFTIIYGYYFLRGKTTTTVIPCINKTWYKVYSCMVISYMVAIFVISSVETNRAPNGMYTSRAPKIDLDCKSKSTWWLKAKDHRFQGLFTTLEDGDTVTRLGKNYTGIPATGLSSNSSMFKNQTYWQYDFTGYCVGRIG